MKQHTQVLPVLTSCLECGNSRLAYQALPILHKIGKDNRFHSTQLEEDETSWLTHQVGGYRLLNGCC